MSTMNGTPILLTLLFSIGGCGAKDERATHPNNTQLSATQPSFEAMHEALDDLREIEGALVAGDLSLAKSLSARASEGIKAEQKSSPSPYVDEYLSSLEELIVSQDVLAAAKASARAGRACGDCHQKLEVQVLQLEPESQPEGDFMWQHRWASERMWEGLVGPSPKAWRVGAQKLADLRFNVSEVEAYFVIDDEVSGHVETLRSVAKQAVDAKDRQTQGSLYGDLLGSCAGCHSRIGDSKD